MTEETALEVIEGEFVQLGTIWVDGPSEVIQRASEIATQLADIVDKRNLYTKISGKKFVRVEGWTTLGAMLGVLPRELRCYPMQNVEGGPINGYEAEVELIRASDGAVIGRGSAICTRDEKNWAKRDDFAIRSMAITRATGKAYRLGFSWIMTLAGYEPTPAEEMTEPEKHKTARPKSTNGSRPLSPGKLKSFLVSKAEGKPETHQTAVATPGQKGLVAGKLAECFAPADDADQKRRSVLLWLWGDDSVKDLTMAAAGATLDWLLDKNADEGTYDLHPAAPQEAQAVLKEALKEAGQQELEL